MVEDDDIARDGRAEGQLPRHSMQGVGYFQIEPDRPLAGEDHVVGLTGRPVACRRYVWTSPSFTLPLNKDCASKTTEVICLLRPLVLSWLMLFLHRL